MTPVNAELPQVRSSQTVPKIVVSTPTTVNTAPFTASSTETLVADGNSKDTEKTGSTPKRNVLLLFRMSSRRELLSYVLPALSLSAVAGLLPPFISLVLGRAFKLYADFVAVQKSSPSTTTLETARHRLVSDMLRVMGILFGVAAFTLIINVAALTVWSWFGDTVSNHIRRRVYIAVSRKRLEWFDNGMDSDYGADAERRGGEAVGGLTARFMRESDDVRLAAGQVLGQLAQYFCTFLACLILALVISAKLTLVILAGFPLIILLTMLTERAAAAKVIEDRDLTSAAAGRVARVVNSISTVKAFNAEQSEMTSFARLSTRIEHAYSVWSTIHGLRLGSSQFLAMSMFIQGFWFGAQLVSEGSLDAGQVMTVFWATLLSASHVHYIMPLLGQLQRAEVGMAGLCELAEEPQLLSRSWTSRSPHRKSSVSSFGAKPIQRIATEKGLRQMQKIRPAQLAGEMSLHNVTFHYPLRPYPATPALSKVSIYIPARETTFIVGQSGSGKSTIAALLMGFYEVDHGSVEVDEQSIEWVDRDWLRSKVALVTQGATAVFEGSIHDNVAMGVAGNLDVTSPADVTRHSVIEACRATRLHDFICGLPDGYDTILSGKRGASLSGGQRQRLALARAYIRDPPVLILDEATSALDVASRTLIHNEVKKWRASKTTVIISHDLAPIAPSDFVYVLEDGCVVESGYRSAIETKTRSRFSCLLQRQTTESIDVESSRASSWSSKLLEWRAKESCHRSPVFTSAGLLSPPPVFGNQTPSRTRIYRNHSNIAHRSQDSVFATYLAASSYFGINRSRPVSRTTCYSTSSLRPSRHESDPSCPGIGSRSDISLDRSLTDMSITTEMEKRAALARGARTRYTKRQEDPEKYDSTTIVEVEAVNPQPRRMSLGLFWLSFYPYVRLRGRLWWGLFFCITMGVATPLFSAFISRLLSALAPGSDVDLVSTSMIVLSLAFLDGVSQGTKYALLQQVAMAWVSNMREQAYGRVLVQDKAWFEEPTNAASSVVVIIIKDAEDARNIIGLIAGQALAATVMITVGVIWAMIVGWELTLTAFAAAPISIGAMFWSTRMVDRYEVKTKACGELVARKFEEAAENVRAIRAMSLERVFLANFDGALSADHRMQVMAAPFAGLPYAIAACVPCIVEGLLFYVGAVLLANGRYDFRRLMEAFALVIFSISFSAQLISYGALVDLLFFAFEIWLNRTKVPAVSKSFRAALDLLRLLELPTRTEESLGSAKVPIEGHLAFKNATFAYPARPEHTVLHDVSFEIYKGECVGLIGASGGGKSTVAALLQRLYEPSDGIVTLDNLMLRQLDVHHLRDHIAVVSQHPDLFDVSICDNITYGMSGDINIQDVVCEAARRAHIHDWIMTLPDGYSTLLGDNASLVSGGQAQRLQLARALARDRKILILDECTSSLDKVNQAAIMETIQEVKEGRTTLMITHKPEMMRMCDRLLVFQEGRLVAIGAFDDLARDNEIFAALIRANEVEAGDP